MAIPLPMLLLVDLFFTDMRPMGSTRKQTIREMFSGPRQRPQTVLPRCFPVVSNSRRCCHTPQTNPQLALVGREERPGLPVGELSKDQKEEMQKVLTKLIEPYRQVDQEEVRACLKAQGGLDACHLAFYRDADIGEDGVWDNWRLEGLAFVWYFRGSPHVHVWVNIADDPQVPLNA